MDGSHTDRYAIKPWQCRRTRRQSNTQTCMCLIHQLNSAKTYSSSCCVLLFCSYQFSMFTANFAACMVGLPVSHSLPFNFGSFPFCSSWWLVVPIITLPCSASTLKHVFSGRKMKNIYVLKSSHVSVSSVRNRGKAHLILLIKKNKMHV
jgi:hypothetical protein